MATIDEIFKAQKTNVARRSAKKAAQAAVVEAATIKDETICMDRNDLDSLKQFDLDSKFGPCTGISRLQRWERAAKFGLDPPEEIRDIILQHQNDHTYSESVWFGFKI